MGRAKIPRDFGQAVRGWAQLLSLSSSEEDSTAVAYCGKNSLPLPEPSLVLLLLLWVGLCS